MAYKSKLILYLGLILLILESQPLLSAFAKNKTTLKDISVQISKSIVEVQNQQKIEPGARLVIEAVSRNSKNGACECRISSIFVNALTSDIKKYGCDVTIIPRKNTQEILDELDMRSDIDAQEHILNKRSADYKIKALFHDENPPRAQISLFNIKKFETILSWQFFLDLSTISNPFSIIECDCDRLCDRGFSFFSLRSKVGKIKKSHPIFKGSNRYVFLADCTSIMPLNPYRTPRPYPAEYIKKLCSKAGARLPDKNELLQISSCIRDNNKNIKTICYANGYIYECNIFSDKIFLVDIADNWKKFSEFWCVYTID